MIIAPLLIYTHSDYKDVWKPLFGQIQKYLPNQKVIVANNEKSDDIPSEYDVVLYDDSKIYTQRLKEILSQLDNKVVMFQHEDMILFNQPDVELINKYVKYVDEGVVDTIKMNYVAGNDTQLNIDNTLITNEHSKFSIQPTLIKVNNFLYLLETTEPLNIWDFEVAIPDTGKNYIPKLGGERKRGIYHYDSFVYPYVATAIVKGKWNYSEYQDELYKIFNEYDIIPINRGMA